MSGLIKEAYYYQQLYENKVKCLLCPHECIISDSRRGICGVRKNLEGILYTETYGNISSLNYDPIEKKPLYHFYPGSLIFSVGSIGCNLKCRFCQNCEISQATTDKYPYLKEYSPVEVVELASGKSGAIGIAYTYNEPTVFYEFMLETAKLAQKTHLKNVVVSNGFIEKKPLIGLITYCDAFNIDLKAFTDTFYVKYTGSKLVPVLETLKIIKESGKHLEITNLIIPGLNSNVKHFTSMVEWIASELGEDTVLHLSRYFPRYKLSKESTPVELLIKFYNIARRKLNYVYLGNVGIVPGGSDTFCPQCHNVTIQRMGFKIEVQGLNQTGQCMYCGKEIIHHYTV